MNLAAIAAVGSGAAIGGIARYLIGLAFVQRFGPGFPWATLAINISGSFLIAVVAQLAETRAFGMTPALRLFAATGVLGGYTTFSAFSLEVLTMTSGAEALAALVYVAASVAGGVAAAFLGQALARLVAG